MLYNPQRFLTHKLVPSTFSFQQRVARHIDTLADQMHTDDCVPERTQLNRPRDATN
jgi:hypothetical protein